MLPVRQTEFLSEGIGCGLRSILKFTLCWLPISFLFSFPAPTASAQQLNGPREVGVAAAEVVEEFDEVGGDDALGEAAAEDLEPDEKYHGMEEILVTAQGGTQNLQDVGISLAAFDADYLEALGAQNIADISQFTPNLEIRTVFAASNPTLFIRGVGLRDFNANSSSAVAVYNDDIYMNSPAGQLGQLFDVQQVEVLRGPQGTLYGRNASAGAIRVITRKPSGDANGYSKVTYGKYNELEVEGALEVPISDTLSMRISARMRKRDGTTKNRCADPRYHTPDDTGNSFTFHNLVHAKCFNRDTTQQDYYPPTRVLDTSLAPGELNELTQQVWLPYYNVMTPAGFSEPVPWYQNSEMIDGMPIEGAKKNPVPFICQYEGGCSYPSPLPDGAMPIAIAANYYSQKWKKGEIPPDISLWTNNVDNWATRGMLRWKPRENVDWLLNVHGGMNRGDSRQFQAIGGRQDYFEFQPDLSVPEDMDRYYDPDLLPRSPWQSGDKPFRRPEDGDPYAGDYNRAGMELLDLYGSSLTGEYRFLDDSLVFRTITGYEGNYRNVFVNFDANPYPYGFEPQYRNEASQFSQEFKLNWSMGDEWSVETGVNYLHENLQTWNTWPIHPTLEYHTQTYETITDYSSAYAWVDWSPVPDFSVTMGGRWNYEVKEMDLLTTQWLRTPFGRFLPPVDRSDAFERISANGPSGDITFSYMPTDDRLFFLKYSHGYKGPHINGGVVNADQKDEDREPLTSPVKPEEVDSLEFGVKTSWLDNQVTVNGAVFFYDYKNIQIFQFRNSNGLVPINQLVNAEDADIYGAEIEIRTHPLYQRVPESIDQLEIFASFGWLNARYTSFLNRLTTVTDGGFSVFQDEDNSGNFLANAPEFAFAGYASWPWETAYGSLTPRFDWSYKSKVFFGPENLDIIAQDALWLMNIRLGYVTPGGSIEISGWVRNLTDTVYRLDVINMARFRRAILYAMGDPRTYGVTINARF